LQEEDSGSLRACGLSLNVPFLLFVVTQNKKVKAPEKWLKMEAWACTKRNSPEESFGRIGVPAQAIVLCLRDDCVVSPTAQPSIFLTPFF